jgi:hypothetical protein
MEELPHANEHGGLGTNRPARLGNLQDDRASIRAPPSNAVPPAAGVVTPPTNPAMEMNDTT